MVYILVLNSAASGSILREQIWWNSRKILVKFRHHKSAANQNKSVMASSWGKFSSPAVPFHAASEHRSVHVRGSSRTSIAAGQKPLLIIARGLIVWVDRCIRADSLRIQWLGPGVDCVGVPQLVILINAVSIQFQHSALESHEFTNGIEPVKQLSAKSFPTNVRTDTNIFVLSRNRWSFGPLPHPVWPWLFAMASRNIITCLWTLGYEMASSLYIVSLARRERLAVCALSCLFLVGALHSFRSWSAPLELLDTDAVSDQWAYMNNQPNPAESTASGAAEQQYMDNLALQSFRKEHETSLRAHVDDASTSKRKKESQSRNRKRHRHRREGSRFYEPGLPTSATQGWSDLLSRVTRELASDTFDIEEMKVETRISACTKWSRWFHLSNYFFRCPLCSLIR